MRVLAGRKESMGACLKRGTILMLLALPACQDLAVENTNAPDRDRALANAADVETLIASSWRDLWGRVQNSSSTTNVMTNVADETTATYANNGSLELSSEPRPYLNNSPLASVHDTPRFQWEDWYQAVSSVADGLGAIADGLVVETGSPPADNTARSWAFGKFMQGVAHGYLALIFDRAYFITEDTDLSDPGALELLSYEEVRDSAEKVLLEAIDYMQDHSFTLPDTWMNGVPATNQDLIKLAYSYLARFHVYLPRSPEERAQVDWDKVLDYTSRGITADHAIALQSGVLTSALLFRVQSSSSFQARADNKLIGPADVSGNYQAWLETPVPDRNKFLITTPDRRITGPTPTSSGSYFRYLSNEFFDQGRGTYHFSYYQWYRNGGRSNSGTFAIMTVDEMNLFRAEAYLRTGDRARAAELINTTRTRAQTIGSTSYPGLPAVTAAGVPQSDDCVPRTRTGACGSLEDALVYERMIELAMLDALRGWFDSRAFGRLPPGTFVQMAIPGRELETLGIENYSFGGVGNVGGAPCEVSALVFTPGC